MLGALDMALTAGVPTKMHVLNLLLRLTCGKAPDLPEIDLPKALALVEEPRANVHRYDGLRSQTQGARDAS